MADGRSERSRTVTTFEKPRDIMDVQAFETSLAETTPHDTVEFEAKKNLLYYWKTYFVGQYRHEYERLYIDLERAGQLRDLLAIDRFMRDDQWPLQQRESDLVGDYIKDAKDAKAILDSLVAIINEEHPGLEIQEADVKSASRAMSKAKQDPDGLRAVSDFARTSIICATPDAVKHVHDWFTKSGHHQVVGVPLVRNTFRGNYQPNGYRDIKLLVEVSLDDECNTSRRTHLCEVQLHFEPFFSLKEGAHKVYEWARELQVRDRMDPQWLFKGMHSELLGEMIRHAQEDWHGLRSLALADLLTTAGRHEEAGVLLKEMFSGAFAKVKQAINAGESLPDETVEGFHRAANELALNCNSRGALHDAHALANTAMVCTEAVFGKEAYSALSVVYNNLASMEYQQANYERALELVSKALQLSSRQGPQHPEHAIDLNTMAMVQWKLGNMDEAEANFRKCCRIQRKLGEYDYYLREDGHDTIPTTIYADAISNLAVFLRSRVGTGHSEEAGLLYEEALAIKQSVRGESHPDVAMALSNLASFTNSQGDEERAIQLLERATSILDGHTLSMAQVDVNWTTPYENLGYFLRKKGELQRAHVLFRNVLDMRSRTDSVHPSLDTTPLIMTYVAEFLMNQNNLPEAERVNKQGLGIVGRCPDFPGVQLAMAAALNNLAIIQMRQGHFSEALATKKAGFAKEQERLDPAHPQLEDSRKALALLSKLAYAAQAEKDTQLAIERSLKDRALGPNSDGHVEDEPLGEITEEEELCQALEMSLRPSTP